MTVYVPVRISSNISWQYLSGFTALDISSSYPNSPVPTVAPFPFPEMPPAIAWKLQLRWRYSALNLAQMPAITRMCKASCCQPLLINEQAPEREDQEVIDLLISIPCPSKANLALVQRNWAVGGKHHFLAVKVHHSHSPIIVPSWAMTFWESVARRWGDIFWWSQVYRLVTLIECHEAVELLAGIPWQTELPIQGVQGRDLARMATTARWTDSQIDLAAWLTNSRLDADVVIFRSAYPNKIVDLYKASVSEGFHADNACPWLKLDLKAIRNGDIQQIGFCLPIGSGTGMPITPCEGNHWVAVVADWRNRRIWFGDSLGHPPDTSILDMLHWWLRPVSKERFLVHTLQCNKQEAEWSSGDHAINMIAHHFSPQEFPLLGGTLDDEICNRIWLLQYIIQEFRRLDCAFARVSRVLEFSRRSRGEIPARSDDFSK
jgi:hypothetical protein